MKRLFLILTLLLLAPSAAFAQAKSSICFTTTGNNCLPVSPTNPFPVNASVTANVGATATATLPTVAPGSGAALYESLSGGLFTNPVYDNQIVDATHGLPVNCIVGCAGGTFNNNADNVATSTGNGQVAAWLYGWNGSGFDRLTVDASKNLNINCVVGCSGGGGGGLSVAFGGAIGANGTPTGFKDGGGNFQPALGDTTNGQWVSVKASVLPTGASTSALQTTGNTALTTINSTLGSPMQNTGGTVTANAGTNLNTSALALETGGNLATIATNIPAKGQALAAASMPVVLTAAQLTTLTPLTSVTANAGTNLNTSLLALESGGNLASLVAQIGAVTASPTANTVLDRLKTINTTLGTPFQAGGSVGISGSLPAGTNVIGHVIVDSGSTTAVTGTVTANLGTLNGAATAAKQPALGTAGSPSADVISIQGVVSGTAVPISASSLPLPTLAATSTKQSDGTQKTQVVDGSGNVIGSTSNSLNVAITSGGGTGGTASSFAATFPATGTAIGVKNGANMVNLTADGSNNLNVNCTVGCAGGSTSNASSGVATSSTNGQSVSWLYGFNGTTWDQLQVDGSKNLKTLSAQGGTWTVQPGNTANTTAWLVTGTGGTFPATQSGTWNINNVSGTVSLPTGASTSALQPTNAAIASTTSGQTGHLVMGAVTTAAPTYTTAQTNPLSLTTAGSLRVDASGSTQPVSGTVTANAGTNLNTSALALETGGNLATLAGAVTSAKIQSNTAQVNGVTTLTGTGAVGTGAQRIAVGTDTATIAGSAPGTAGTPSTNVITVQGATSMTKLLVTPDSVALPANQSVNVSQINAVTPLMGNGVTGTGSQRVTIASDNTAIAGAGVVAAGAAPGNVVLMGDISSGTVNGIIHCDSTAIYDASTSGSTQLVALTSGQTIYVCGYSFGVGSTATNVKLIYGTGTACATGSNNLTPAYQLAANGGLVDRSPYFGGMKTAASNALCINTSAGNAVQAVVYYTKY